MRRNWPFFKDSDWLILVFVHSAKPTAELENLAMSPSLSSPGLSYDTKFVHIGLELRSSSVGDTILGVQSEPACIHQVLRSIQLTVCPPPCTASGRRYGKFKESLGETTTPVQWPMKSIRNNGSVGRPTGWGRRPHLIQYLL